MDKLNRYKETLYELKRSDNYRYLPDNDSDHLLDLCSNDYLGINSDELVYREFSDRLGDKSYRFGSCSSRLLSGNSIEHKMLEDLISQRYGSEACLLYNSGYHANIGILQALVTKNDLVITDKFVHASILDGCKLSQGKLIRFGHLDYQHLEKILQKNRKDYENVFIISESIFSMDGDVADLEKLCDLKLKYNCFLYIDEAHAIGVRGKNGLGCAEESQLIRNVDFLIGTFGKALASIGAFVVCNNLFKQYLVNHSRSLIFTTALPPVNLAWSTFIFEQLPNFKQRREKLKTISHQFSRLLGLEPCSHIIPYIVGTNKEVVARSQMLKQHGYRVLPIRYPTVPRGTARLRFSIRAGMDLGQLKPVTEILKIYEKGLDT